LQEVGIHSVPELIKAAESGALRSLPRFSEVLEKKILSNARNVTARSQRYPLAQVQADVGTLVKTLKRVKGVLRCDAAGSYRRQKETVGDIDILVAFQDASDDAARSERIAKAVQSMPIVSAIVAKGPTRLAFNLKTGLRVDIRLVKPEEWGSAFLYFTGSKEHNISLRRLAIVQGMKLSEYGLFTGEKVVASKEEQDIYKALGLPFIEPAHRTGDLPA
jgi:DNA polymerase (family 10)